MHQCLMYVSKLPFCVYGLTNKLILCKYCGDLSKSSICVNAVLVYHICGSYGNVLLFLQKYC